MASRVRMIHPTFFKNEGLGEMEPYSRLLFIGLWTIADREGRLEDRPKRIKADVFPYDDGLDVDAMLGSLSAAGFIQRYTVNGANYIVIPTFTKYQKPHIREAQSVIPGPDESTVNDQGMTKDVPRHDLGVAEAPPRRPVTGNRYTESVTGNKARQGLPETDPPDDGLPVAVRELRDTVLMALPANRRYDVATMDECELLAQDFADSASVVTDAIAAIRRQGKVPWPGQIRQQITPAKPDRPVVMNPPLDMRYAPEYLREKSS